MTNIEIIKTLDNVINVISNVDFKGKDCAKVVSILQALSAIQEELQNRKDDD